MRFQYMAYTLDKGVFKGRLEARSEADARTDLAGRGFKLLKVSRAMQLPPLEKAIPSLYKVKVGDLIAFARQASTMLASGANLLRVLEMLRDESNNKGMRLILTDIHDRVSEGDEFTAALREHPNVFDEVFLSLTEVGEHTGRLGPALEQLADILVQAHEAKQKAMKTMMMPLFLIGSSFLMLGFMAFVALPPLLDTFEKMGVEIPMMTTMMVGATKWLVENIIPVAIGIAGTFALYKLVRRISSAKYVLDFIKARLPLMGQVMLASELGRFTRIIATMLENGVDLPTALRLGLNSSKNEALRRAWLGAEEGLMAGQRVAEGLSRHKILPSMFIELWSIGEEGNTLPKTMGELADAYEKQYEDRISAILAVAEPVSTFAVGGVVLFMALSVMKPIMSAASAVQ